MAKIIMKNKSKKNFKELNYFIHRVVFLNVSASNLAANQCH
jgi:hypothetical protein